MPLTIKLKPNERVIVGSAVIRNGGGPAALVIENHVPVLRDADILGPGDVCTPCERLYLALQLIYLMPEQRERHVAMYRTLAEEVVAAAPSCARYTALIDEHLATGSDYQAIKSGYDLRIHERELMTHAR
jgi:flagellar biosynthesis repressor protein FlbT